MSNEPNHTGENLWPEMDFFKLPLSQAARQQLSAVFRHNRNEGGSAKRLRLLSLLRHNAFNVRSGIYIPVGDRVQIPSKLPVQSGLFVSKTPSFPLEPLPVSFFSNALLIPEAFGTPDFDPHAALAPRDRLVNCGCLIATQEFDPTNREQFEEMLSWIRGASGKFASSKFANVDRALCRYREYLGYTIVYSGRCSLHFHFVFSTAHLQAVPYNSDADGRRLRCEEASALMHNVHDRYWDRAAEVIVHELQPSFCLDEKMRNATQWRRLGGGVRQVEKTTAFLGLEIGMRVPQLIVAENIRKRAPRLADGYLVSSGIALSSPPPRRLRRLSTPLPNASISDAAIGLMQDLCRSEWGSEYPMPVAISRQNEDVMVRFKNHAEDRNPSTVCIGQHRKLLVAGNHTFEGNFYLPDNMTADEFVRHVQLRCGAVSDPKAPIVPSGALPPEFQFRKRTTCLADLRERSRAGSDALTDYIAHPFRDILRDTDDRESRIGKLRDALPDVVGRLRGMDSNYLLQLQEGAAKSTAHFKLIKSEALYNAIESSVIGSESFTTFASRSAAQAEEKAKEYEKLTGGDAVVVTPLQRTYEQVCLEENEKPIQGREFRDGSLSGRLQMIKLAQPSVYARLEEHRRSLWRKGSRNLYNGSSTILFMTHSMAQFWSQSRVTRLWLNPSFDPARPDIELAGRPESEFRLSSVIYDELEPDGFVNLLREDLFGLIGREQRRYPSWRDLPRHQRLDAFSWLLSDKAIPGKPLSFEEFDSLMRLDLEKLKRLEVNFDEIPYGYDNKPNGLYNRTNENVFYAGQQTWFSASATRWGFLTTENLTGRIVEAVHCRMGRQLISFSMPNVPGIHPIRVPVVLDPRAGADQSGKEKVSTLAKEICDANPNAIVIADGAKGMDRVLTFQSAKGRNGLEEKDVYIILTNLAPAKYEELNVLGQWLEIPNVISMFYQDQINQAVGRNTGFRQSTQRATRTVVITSKRFYASVIKALDPKGRVQLYLCDQKHW